MQSSLPSQLYFHRQQFADLRLDATKGDKAQAAESVARQFEGLFMQMMLKNMRSAAVFDPSQHSQSQDFYQDMFDKQLSYNLAQHGGIGIARLLMQQLGQQNENRQEVAVGNGDSLPVYSLDSYHPVNQIPVFYQSGKSAPMQSDQVQAFRLTTEMTQGEVSETNQKPLHSEDIVPFYGWKTRQDFVNDIYPHAQKAAQALGVSTNLLVAQAALESGWGQHLIRHQDGSAAFNLFGIKSGSSWTGGRVSQSTLEFRNQVMQREMASFRAYDSVADGLEDYQQFISQSSRYQDALNHNGSDEHYIRGLQKAGYATDPNYADKVLGIVNGKTLKNTLAMLDKTGRSDLA